MPKPKPAPEAEQAASQSDEGAAETLLTGSAEQAAETADAATETAAATGSEPIVTHVLAHADKVDLEAVLAADPAAVLLSQGDMTGAETSDELAAEMELAEHERVARVCYEVNRGYCQAIGDDSQLPWSDAPEHARASAVAGVKFAVSNPDSTPRDQHDAWCLAKIADGWGYGPVKDATNKTHPCLVAYDLLPQEQKVKDHLFRAVVRALLG